MAEQIVICIFFILSLSKEGDEKNVSCNWTIAIEHPEAYFKSSFFRFHFSSFDVSEKQLRCEEKKSIKKCRASERVMKYMMLLL